MRAAAQDFHRARLGLAPAGRRGSGAGSRMGPQTRKRGRAADHRHPDRHVRTGDRGRTVRVRPQPGRRGERLATPRCWSATTVYASIGSSRPSWRASNGPWTSPKPDPACSARSQPPREGTAGALDCLVQIQRAAADRAGAVAVRRAVRAGMCRGRPHSLSPSGGCSGALFRDPNPLAEADRYLSDSRHGPRTRRTSRRRERRCCRRTRCHGIGVDHR